MDPREDLYSDSSPARGAPESAPDEGAPTALLPKSFFPEPPQPGKVCRVRVEQVMDDQVAVSYAKAEEEEPEESAPPGMPMDEEMAGYMT